MKRTLSFILALVLLLGLMPMGVVATEAEHIHSYESVVTAPTCTEQGYTTYSCECGDSYVGDYVDATGEHTWGNWTELVAPTCDAEGKDQRICADCGEKQYRDTRISGDANKLLVSNPLTKDDFVGKKVLLIGDSITAGVGTTKTYGAYLAESLGVTVTNKGSSGTGYCSGGAMATNKNLTEANVRNADIITIMLGVNDWDWAVKEGSWKGNPEYYDKSQTYYQLGDFNSTDTSTFYGALHAWCQKILAMQQMEGFEDKQFIVITPLITSWNVSVTSKKDWNQDKRNIHGHAFREYCTAIMEVCAYYDIPVFDANMFSGIYYKSAENNNVAETGGDGVHVNEAGHALLAESLEEFLLEGYTYETRNVKNGGHTYVNGICADCRLPYACNHVYNAVITAPTCTEQGYTTYTCACGDSYVGDYVEATGHSYSGRFACGECGYEAKVSVLGDSISTYTGIPGVKNAVYPNSSVKAVTDTWWRQVVDVQGGEVLKVNASGGSRILSDEYFNGAGIRDGNHAVYRDRCVNLHVGNENPDMILVFMGTNDFSYHVESECERCQILLACTECTSRADGNLNVCAACRAASGVNSSFCNLPLGTADGVDIFRETPTSSCEAYAIALSKMKAAYPDAQIYCFGLLPRVSPYQSVVYHDHGQPTVFNAELKKVAENAGAAFIDLEQCIDNSASTWNTYFGDAVHPTATGMDKIAEAVISGILGCGVYAVSSSISSGITLSGASWAIAGETYEAKITASSGMQLNVRVMMNGSDITESAYDAQTGKINIKNVTGNVVITAKAKLILGEITWSVGAVNSTNGSLVDMNTRIRTNMFDVTRGAVITAVNGAEFCPVFYDEDGEFVSSPNAYDSDGVLVIPAGQYVYMRLMTRNQNNTNEMMTPAYGENITVTFGSQKANWSIGTIYCGDHANGFDANNYNNRIRTSFIAIGEGVTVRAGNDAQINVVFYDEHFKILPTGNNCGWTTEWSSADAPASAAYIRVAAKDKSDRVLTVDYGENITLSHTHSYTLAVTLPTCTEPGYTTYTCACGDSYVGDYVAATGHSYENVICAVCGAVKPMESVDSVDALVTALRQAMVRRQNQIQLRLNGIVLASTEISDLVKKAMAHTGIPYEGDYIRANMVGYSWALTTGSDDTGVYSIVTVTCNFISDAQMEAEVDAAVEALLNKLNLWNASNYEKVKGVYDWITENVSYDYDWDDLEDDTNYYKHTTYAALIDKNAVCQGIASLYYRLMLELGVDCRYISGISTDITGTERHAWNIVYLDGKYYNCDPTWDLGLTGYYRHFLCTKGNFSGHTRDAEFDTTQFHTDYPMAVTPYVLNVAASGTVNSKISWVLDGDTGTLTVAGTGAIPSYRSSRAPWYDYRESVRKIVISEGITEVGERAFYWCTNCTQVDLPDSLVAIREYGFNNLRSLKNITLPSKLKTIEFCAFSECVALTSITLPDSVTTVGSNAFSNCYELTSAVLSGGMKTIPSSMFGGDSKLKTVVLPEGVTYIDDTAFINCGFYSFTLPASVTGLGTSVFSGCTSLSKFIVEEGNSAYKAVDGVLFSADGTHLICYPSAKTGNYTVPEGTKYIDYGAFRSQRYMYYVYFPSTLIKIDGYAFSYCKNLTGVTFNSNITTIGDSAFRSCTNLKSVTFENPNVTLVGYTFADCTALRTITLPSKLKEIPNGLFSGCTNLQSIAIPSTVTKIGSSAFIDCDSLTTITIPGTVKSIGQQAFDFCNKLETIVFEEGVTTLGWLCIRNAPKLKKVVIPSSVTTIDQPSNTTSYTFDDCPNMVLYVTCGSYIHSYAVRKGLSHQVSHTVKAVIAAPTCTKQGYTTYTCTACGDSYVADYTDALGHTAGADADCTNAQTCIICGVVLNAALGHSYNAVVTAPDCVNGGYTTYTCSACGDSYVADYVDATGHTAGADADCTNPQVCTVCGVVLNAALGHSYDAFVTAPDCVNGGYTTYTCSACGDSYVADHTAALGHTAGADADCTNAQVCTVCGFVLNAALGHSYNAVVTAPDCVNGGYTTYTCTACGDGYVADYTDALGHTAGAAADCTNAQVCTVCGVVLNPALGHSYDSVVTAPDCVNGGYTTYTCSACGDSYVGDYTDATAHVYDHENDTTCNQCGAVRQIAARILGGGETSVSEDVNGLAFLFTADVSGAQTANVYEYVANSASVTPFVDGASYKLVRMGAEVSNGVQTIDIEAKYLWDVAADQCSFAVRIVDIPENQLDCVITARPYYVYEVDGEEIVVYGDVVSKSYNDVQ